jgi:hypothetical protein
MVEHFVEQIFFRKWHHNEAALRRFVKQASHITELAPLVDAYTSALQRFIGGGGGCAIYQRAPDGIYVSIGAIMTDLPLEIDFNDALVVEMRAEQLPVSNQDTHSSMPFALALPILHRGQLDGFVLLGAKNNQESYRPDEVEVLAFAAHQIGLDLDGIQAEILRNRIRVLDQENNALNIQVAFAKEAGLMRAEHA